MFCHYVITCNMCTGVTGVLKQIHCPRLCCLCLVIPPHVCHVIQPMTFATTAALSDLLSYIVKCTISCLVHSKSLFNKQPGTHAYMQVHWQPLSRQIHVVSRLLHTIHMCSITKCRTCLYMCNYSKSSSGHVYLCTYPDSVITKEMSVHWNTPTHTHSYMGVMYTPRRQSVDSEQCFEVLFAKPLMSVSLSASILPEWGAGRTLTG